MAKENDLGTEMLAQYMPTRPDNANKYTFGSLLIIAGSRGMTGAAVLAAKAALRAGAGLATVACPDSERLIIASSLPEIMTFGTNTENGTFCLESSEEILGFIASKKFSAILIGPGLSCTDNTAAFVKNILENCCLPTVIDADALNCISRLGGFGKIRRSGNSAPVIITPHEGEAARLLGVKKIGDRKATARELSILCDGIAILKGPGTLVSCVSHYMRKDRLSCDYSGKHNGIEPFSEFENCILYRNNTGGSELAKAGSGDVLAGITASVYMQNGLAKGFCHNTAFESSVLSVWLHGKCGHIASKKYGRRGVIASDLIEALPQAFPMSN